MSGETFPDHTQYAEWVNAQVREVRRVCGLGPLSESDREALALRFEAFRPSDQQAAQRQLAQIARRYGLPNPAGYAAMEIRALREDARIFAQRRAATLYYADEINLGPISAKSSGPNASSAFWSALGLAAGAAAIVVAARHADRVLAAGGR